ncbi:MAG: T9SS C-terminal target domain-containing protein [Flavobacterium sp.]|nr:MAG: T9SS C-terminal target domain-containing protein [Flavobacterium sp.]
MQKKRIILFFLVFGCFSVSKAQDPALLNVDWYLHTLSINGENYTPPVNSEVLYVKAYFDELDQFDTAVCNGLIGTLNYSSNEFTFLTWGITLLECEMTVNADFEELYAYYFFIDHIDDPFQYDIINETNGSKTLIINNNVGDMAIYNTELLSINIPTPVDFTVYPIPATDMINISAKERIQLQSITLYDFNGTITHNIQLPKSDPSIDLSNLKSGVYILKIITISGEIHLKKLIKK